VIQKSRVGRMKRKTSSVLLITIFMFGLKIDCVITVFQYQPDDGTNVGYGGVKRLSMAGSYLVN
jgi:hypothetical protein